MIAQIPWLERKFSFDFPVSLFPVIFNRLEGSIYRLAAMLANADENLCADTGNGWSVKEHLGHLYDLEDLWWKRLNDFRQNLPMLTAADMTNTRTKEAKHNLRPTEQLLQMFTAERQKILKVIYPFDEDMLSRTSIHPRLKQPMRVVDSLYFVAEHDDHHIAHIGTTLGMPNA